MYVCKFCSAEKKNNNSLVQHQIRCKLNPEKISVTSNLGNFIKKGHKGSNQYLKAEKLGLEKPKITEQTRRKISEKSKQYVWTSERRSAQSKSMLEAVKKYPDSYNASNVCGRVKNIDVVDSYGNSTKIKGKWEQIVADALNANSIKWQTVREGFEYVWEDSIHLYFPDFYLPELDTYIEVKGYEREKDRVKWSSFSKKLIIFKQKEIKNITEHIPSLL